MSGDTPRNWRFVPVHVKYDATGSAIRYPNPILNALVAISRPAVFVPTRVASPSWDANPSTISAALAECSLTTFARLAYGRKMHDFFQALLARAYATARSRGRHQARLYHIHYKTGGICRR